MQLADGKKLNHIEEQIHAYIHSNPEQIEQMPIHELADRTFTSSAAIVRYCKKFGFNGYRDFRLAFVKELESQKLVLDHEDFSHPFDQNASAWQVETALASLYTDNINLLQATLNLSDLAHMAHYISRCRHLYMYAIGDSALTVQRFINRLIKIDLYPILTTRSREEFYYSQHSTPRDCALFVTYSGQDRVFGKCLRVLKKNGTRIFAMTANPQSLAAEMADIRILIPDEEKRDKLATFFSQQSFSFILDLLYCLIYRLNFEENQKLVENGRDLLQSLSG